MVTAPSAKESYFKWASEWHPTHGDQEVGVELVKMKCWKCHQEIINFLGLVFPVSPMSTWKEGSRLYFSHLLLAKLLSYELENAIIDSRSRLVEKYGPSVAKLGYKQGKQSVPYFCSICPYCNVLHGGHYAIIDRFNFVRATWEGKIKDPFLYHPLQLKIGMGIWLTLKKGANESSGFSIYHFLSADEVHTKIDGLFHRLDREAPEKISTSLIDALKTNRIDILKEFLNLGANLNQVDENGDNPFSIAEKYSPREGFSLLKETEKKREEYAAAKERAKTVNLLKAWSDIDKLNPLRAPRGWNIFSEQTRWHSEIYPSKKEDVYIYTFSLYETPLAPIILELTRLLNGPQPEEENLPREKISLVAFRTDERGYPIEGTLRISLIFDELQRLKGNCGERIISKMLEEWYRSFFPQHSHNDWDDDELHPKKSLFPISHAIRPLTFEDVKKIREELDKTYLKDILESADCKKLVYHKYNYPKNTLSEDNIQEIDGDFSYYAEDILLTVRRIEKQECGEALKMFLKDKAPTDRIDWLEKPQKMVEACIPRHLPPGRWPSNLDHHLCLAQQAAVNTSLQLKGREGIIAINGPPGTGKTTLLRDMIADIVVQRACRLSLLEEATDLFARKETIDQTTIHFLQKGFSSCEEAIVIASSNNKAVENISLELPLESQIDARFLEEFPYFRKIATKLLSVINQSGNCWGMISAPLGKRSNRKNFVKGVWADLKKTDGEVLFGLKTLLQDNKRLEKTPSFAQAKATFEALLDEYKKKITTLQELDSTLVRLEDLKKAITCVKEEMREIRSRIEKECACRDDICDHIELLEEELQGFSFALESVQKDKPSLFPFKISWRSPLKISFFNSWKSYKHWQEVILDFKREIEDKERIKKESEEGKEYLETLIEEYCKTEWEKLEELQGIQYKIDQLSDRKTQLELLHPDVEVTDFSQLTLEESHCVTPWKSATLNQLRSLLFLLALDMHKAVIYENRHAFLGNLASLTKFMGGEAKGLSLSKEIKEELWATLFMVVPVISTTFAAFGSPSLFQSMSLRSLGWVFIDEAGQAAPHQAVGAFSRAKRVIVLGDPMQLPPIVTIPKELTELILNKYQVSPKLFSVNQYSVQTMSDRNAEIGTWVRQGYEKIWTGLPLRVHRRCRDPMFKISNEIAYDRQMVQARSQKAPPNRLGESFWLDVVGKKLLKWDSHAFQEEIDALLMLIQQSDRDLKTYVITPFKSISFALRNKLPKSIDCGTIHSFQGKEADVVFLILGGNTKMSGAIGWAANQRNLLNTAVTRAKHYLYIIGNYDVWQNQGFFEEISKAFPRKQLHQNEDPLASEQEVPIVNIEC